MVIDKTLLANRPLWIPSSNFPKAFDRVDWDALWRGLRLHWVSAHLVWLLQVVYSNQTGQMSGHTDVSREFCIRAGVRRSNKNGPPSPKSNPLCETKGCLQKLGVVQIRMLRSIVGWVRILHDDMSWRDSMVQMNHKLAIARPLFPCTGGLGTQTLPIELSTCTLDCTLTWRMAG